MKTILFSVCFFSITLSLPAQQFERYITAANGQGIAFLEARPDNYEDQKHPVIIFLHGTDERGTGKADLKKLVRQGLPRILESQTLSFNGKSFIVLSPQLDKRWGDWQPFYIDEMLKYAATLSIDSSRIYLTGLSIGGGAVWAYLSEPANRRKFAAAVPIAAVCFYEYKKLVNIAKAKIPVWAFVGESDKTVNTLCTTQAVDAVNAAKPPVAAKLTVYKAVGHNAWDRAYDPTHKYQQPNVYEWMLKYHKK